MKKKVLVALITGLIILGGTKSVYALEDVYYTNPNGVEMSEKEYTFLTTLFANVYVDLITQDEFDEYKTDGLFDSTIETETYNEPLLPIQYPGASIQSDTHATPAKTLQIGKSCTATYCMISLLNTWHVVPSVKSWDNIGIYTSGTTVKSHSFTLASSTADTQYFTNIVQSTNGLGNSVDLPDSGTNYIVNMAVKVNKNGTVFGSYQHAMTTTTLPVSQKYYLDLGGYGNVFLYYGAAVGIYDGMGGVDISV